METSEVIDIFREAGRRARRPFHPDVWPAQPGLPAEGARLHACRQDREALPGAGGEDQERCARQDRLCRRPGDRRADPGLRNLAPSRRAGDLGRARKRRVQPAPFRDRERQQDRHRRGYRHHGPVDPRNHRMPARSGRRSGGCRLHHRPVGRQDRCRRAADRACRIRSAGLSLPTGCRRSSRRFRRSSPEAATSRLHLLYCPCTNENP